MTAALKAPSFKYIAAGLIGLAFSCSLLFVAAPKAHASGLNSTQISAILSLLQSFGADQNTINSVNAALSGGTIALVPSIKVIAADGNGPASITFSYSNMPTRTSGVAVCMPNSGGCTEWVATSFKRVTGSGTYTISTADGNSGSTKGLANGTYDLVVIGDSFSDQIATSPSFTIPFNQTAIADVDLKINGSNGLITIGDTSVPVTVSWTTGSNVSTCQLAGIKGQAWSKIQKTNDSFSALLDIGSLNISTTHTSDGSRTHGVYLQCVKTTGGLYRQVSDEVPLIIPSLDPVPVTKITGTISPSSLYATTYTPTITGTAVNANTVGIAIGDNGGKAYGSGQIPVYYIGKSSEGGTWAVTVSPALQPQTTPYDVYLYDANNNTLASGKLNITPNTSNELVIKGTPTSGAAPLVVTFSAEFPASYNTPRINYGDGISESMRALSSTCPISQAPCLQHYTATHTYATAGTYQVGGSTYLTPGPCPAGAACMAPPLMSLAGPKVTVTGASTEANIYGTPTSGAAPLAVQFSTSLPSNFAAPTINFGDGTTGRMTFVPSGCLCAVGVPCSCPVYYNTSHTYTAAGTYKVSGSAAYACTAGTACPALTLAINGPTINVSVVDPIPTATYQGYLDGHLFITTQNITRADALANCKRNATANPSHTVRCTWGTEEIYNNTTSTSTGNLTVSLSATPIGQEIIAGATQATFTNIFFDATASSQDILIKIVPVRYSFTGNSNDLSNCKLYAGSTVVSSAAGYNPAAGLQSPQAVSITLNGNGVTVAKGTLATLTMKCDVHPVATSAFSFGINAADVITAVTTNGGTVTSKLVTNPGNTMTVASAGRLSVSRDSTSPSYGVVTAGSTGVTLGAFKFSASKEAIKLTSIRIALDDFTATPADVTQFTVWDGSTMVGTAVMFASNHLAMRYSATATLSSAVTIPANGSKTLTIRADIASIGVSQPGKSGDTLSVAIDGAKGTGLSSGLNLEGTFGTSAATTQFTPGIRVYKTFPTITYSTASGTLIAGDQNLLTLQVTADAKGDVQLGRLIFGLSVSGVTMSNIRLTGPSGSVGSILYDPSTATVRFDSPSNTVDRVIAAGQTKSYTLRATVALTAGYATHSVSISLKADRAVSNPASGFPNANVVWSPMTSGFQTSTTAADWYNGYGLGGCFAISGLGQDCFARVLTNDTPTPVPAPTPGADTSGGSGAYNSLAPAAMIAGAAAANMPRTTLSGVGCTLSNAATPCALSITWSAQNTSGSIDAYVTYPNGTRSRWFTGTAAGSQSAFNASVGAYLIQIYDHTAGGVGTPLAQTTLNVNAPLGIAAMQNVAAVAVIAAQIPFQLVTDALGEIFYQVGLGGSGVAAAAVAIPAPTVTVYASNSTKQSKNGTFSIPGGLIDVLWSSKNATNCSLSPATQAISPAGFSASNAGISGYVLVKIAQDSTYTVTCTNASGVSASGSVSIVISPKPTLTVRATNSNAGSVNGVFTTPGGLTDISWTSQYVDSCSVSPAPQVVSPTKFSASNAGTNGYFMFKAAQDATYTVTCKNNSDITVTDSVKVVVSPKPTITLYASNESKQGSGTFTTASGNLLNIIWTTTNVTSCAVSPAPAVLSPAKFSAANAGAKGYFLFKATQTTTYTLNCKNDYDLPVSASIQIQVTNQAVSSADGPINMMATVVAAPYELITDALGEVFYQTGLY